MFRCVFARDHIFEDYFATGLTSVLAHCQGLTTEEHESVTGAFTQGKAAVVSLLTLKAQFWALIPWKLAGLAHWDTALAAECARTCIAQYEKRPVDAEHHRVTVEFLSPAGRWRPAVERLAQGTPLLSLAVHFVTRCMHLGWMPVVERVMEARHAYVQQRLRLGKRKKRSPTTVSLGSGRMREIEERLHCTPCFSEALMTYFEDMRNPRQALRILGLSDHPRCTALCHILDHEQQGKGNIILHFGPL